MSGFRRERNEEQEQGSSSWWGIALGAIAVAAGAGAAFYTVKQAEQAYQKERQDHLAQHGENFVMAEELLESGKLQLGDLIEFRRSHYQHWVLYIGNGKVVHFLNSGIVRVDDLIKVAEGDYCRINLQEKKAKTLKLERTRTRKEVVDYALGKVGSTIKYDLHLCNCEHFVMECFYGKSFSGQQDLLDRNTTIKYLGKIAATTYRAE